MPFYSNDQLSHETLTGPAVDLYEDEIAVLPFENDTRVRHKRLGWTGTVQGRTPDKVAIFLDGSRRTLYAYPGSLEILNSGQIENPGEVGAEATFTNTTESLAPVQQPEQVGEGSIGTDYKPDTRTAQKIEQDKVRGRQARDDRSVPPGEVLPGDGQDNLGGSSPGVREGVSLPTTLTT